MIESEKLIKFFDAQYFTEQEADELKKGIRDDLAEFAKNNEIEPKAIKSAYALYKRYKGGKNSQKDCEDYSELSGIIENYFAEGTDDL